MQKVALIIGGGSGIGRAVAETAKKAGYIVAIVGRTEKRITEAAAELGVSSFVADMANEAAADAVFVKLVNKHGGLDLLVNAAGVFAEKSLSETSRLELNVMFDANVAPLFESNSLAVKQASPERRVTIVNISSFAGVQGMALPNRTLYSGAKAWMNGFTQSLDGEMRQAGTGRAYVVAPGFVEGTPMAAVVQQTSHVDHGSGISPREVAKLVMMLVNEQPNDWLWLIDKEGARSIA